uniref:Small ribosomal subunit protein uS3c n=1 Tax=Zygnema circumcarinatum TaxID=35869 RepID=A0A6N0GXJ5_ZYGCR|nr:ribosomal protein S3 [Zygnema circumcarinatum]
MGQKIHPLGFRLGVTQEHHSTWFAPLNNYSELLQEDERIRNCIQQFIRKYVRNSSRSAGIARVQIQKKTDLVEVEIHTAFPSLLVQTRVPNRLTNTPDIGIEHLRHNIQQALSSGNRKLNMTLSQVVKPYGEAIILAEYIALQLESRVPFRKTIKEAIKLANNSGNVKGIKIQIAGRLNGAEIARVEWAREGRVPLHTVRAQIDYCHYSAQTIYGVLGIKVWVFQNQPMILHNQSINRQSEY